MTKARKSDSAEIRNKWEKFLEDRNIEVLRAYRHYKKKAQKDGKDPIRVFRDAIGQQCGQEEATRFWLAAVGSRIVESTKEDEDFLYHSTSNINWDLDDLISHTRDPRKAADIFRASKIKELERVPYNAIYQIVDKLIEAKGTKPPPPGSSIFDKAPSEELKNNPEVFELLVKIDIENQVALFEKDYDKALKDLEIKAKSQTEEFKKRGLSRVLKYYEELKDFKIPGIIDEVEDSETGKIKPFPAIHQKTACKFIINEKRVLIADEMGLGKTASAIISKNLIDVEEGGRTCAVAVVPKNMIEHWQKEVKKWNKSELVVRVIDCNTTDEQIKKIIREKPDFIITNYEMVRKKRNGHTLAEALAEVCDYLIADEMHNAKKPDGKTSEAIMTLSKSAEYVAMLSGTPIPNRLSDLGVIASILYNHEISPKGFNKKYGKNASVVRTWIIPKMLRRKREDTFGKGKCTIHEVPVAMTPKAQIAQELILINKEGKGALALVQELRKCSLDPRLVGLDEDSPKYAKLVQMAKESKGKMVVFSSDLKKGVLDPIQALLEEAGLSVARVDGDITGKKRKKQLEWFKEGDADILLATLKTLGEGQDLTCAARCYFIDAPFNDARFSQGVARLDRKGQKQAVEVFLLMSENSIDERLLRLMKQKKKLEQYLIDGFAMTPPEKRLLEKGEKMFAAGKDPLRKLYLIFGWMTNSDTPSIIRLLNDPQIAKFIAEEYWKNFDGSYYGNTNNLIKQIIESIEDKGRKFNRILDLASGPCCLSRALGRPVVSLDASKIALEVGRFGLIENGVTSGPNIHASFREIPFANNSFDCLVFSLGILHSSIDEREQILREISRIMEDDGVLILTVPSGEGRFDKLGAALKKMGFDIVTEVTGTAQDAKLHKYESVVITAIKSREASPRKLPRDLLDFRVDSMSSEDWEASVSSVIRKKKHDQFEIDGVGTWDAVATAAKEIVVKRSTIRKLEAEFGSTKGIFENCPKERLEDLGLVCYKLGGAYNITTITEYELRMKHDEFVKGKGKRKKNVRTQRCKR
jgi:ubiquinone/menaquinone biosynthesis C-methylase UbiE/superfamily II DNA/RNA helicase